MTDLKDRTNDFDDFEPLNGHRERFQGRLEREIHTKKTPFGWIKIAASILVLIALSGVFYQFLSVEEDIRKTAATETKESFPLETAENYYEQSFNSQFAAIAKNYTDAESLLMIEKSEVLIQELRDKYKTLEKELKLTGDKRVAAAMILNYKSRIDILEQLIKKLEYVNNIKKQTNEEVNV